MAKLFALHFIAFVLTAVCAALPTIDIKGSKFFTSDGNQFFIKGIAYQLTPDDPLANPSQCQKDAALMKTLGTNSIRVYHVDSSANHDGCMKAFSDAGIYAWIDVDTFDTYVLGNDPQWTKSQFQAYQKVMDAFHNYDNVAGFFVGNEVLSKGSDSPSAPYVKAAARDMKAYRDNKGYRAIPVGYSAADIADLRPNLQNYMACISGSDTAATLDFFSLNAYEWCGENNYAQSGYVQLQQWATGYSIPIFFSETGCNTVTPRTFGDQSAIFGSNMSDTWSGSIIYEWIQETNQYGLIKYGPPAASGKDVSDGFVRAGNPTPIEPEFSNLSKQWAAVSPSSISKNAYHPKLSPPACPGYTSGLWEVKGDAALPTLAERSNPPKTASSDPTGVTTPGTSGTPSKTTQRQGPTPVAESSATSSSAAAATRLRLLL